MKSLILTAGNGSRLYPITRVTPKALLDVKGKLVLDHIVSNLDSPRNINKFYILSRNDLHHLDKKIFKENAGELIKHLVDNGQEVYGFEFSSGWYDIGTPEDLER